MFSTEDDARMQRALELAERGLYLTTPNPRVGCVLVRDDAVIGEGFTQPAGQNHAEIEALNDARARGHDPRGATVYVTLEPCSHFGRTPPCVNALIDAGVARVIAAMEDPNPQVSGKGLASLRAAGIDVRCGLFERESRELNIGFVSRMTRGRPWVRMKIAASLDGASALLNGRSQWITGDAARADGHAWRARACAILTGIGTVRADNPAMTVRLVETTRQPLRVLIDSRLEIDLDARIARGANLLVATARNDPWKERELADRGCEVLHLPDEQGRVSLNRLMAELAVRGINELHVEAGPRLNGALLQQGLADELLVYLAPGLLGQGLPMFELPALDDLDQRLRLAYRETAMVGDDLRIIARIAEVARMTDPIEVSEIEEPH